MQIKYKTHIITEPIESSLCSESKIYDDAGQKIREFNLSKLNSLFPTPVRHLQVTCSY